MYGGDVGTDAGMYGGAVTGEAEDVVGVHDGHSCGVDG